MTWKLKSMGCREEWILLKILMFRVVLVHITFVFTISAYCYGLIDAVGCHGNTVIIVYEKSNISARK